MIGSVNPGCGSVEKISKRTAFTAIGATQNKIDSLTNRVLDLAERLVGGMPQSDMATLRPQALGLLGSIIAGCEDADAKIEAAHAAIDRILSEMP